MIKWDFQYHTYYVNGQALQVIEHEHMANSAIDGINKFIFRTDVIGGNTIYVDAILTSLEGESFAERFDNISAGVLNTKGLTSDYGRFKSIQSDFAIIDNEGNYKNAEGILGKQWATGFLLTIALFVWGLGDIPLVLYMHRRFVTIGKLWVRLCTLFLLIGCIGMLLVGIFPDAHVPISDPEGITYTDIHSKVAIVSIGGFGAGFIFLGFLLAKDRFSWMPRGGKQVFDHNKVRWPYFFFTVIILIAGSFLLAWEFVYPIQKAADPTIGSHWGAAICTIYSFPLWENVLIYTLVIFFQWLLLSIPEKIPKIE
jgi:hypothetical protein